MRKWCVVFAMGLFIALPAVAQEKSSAAGSDESTSTATTDSTSAPATSTAASSVAPASSNIFAVPMPPRATPFPAPSASLGGTDDAIGRQVPKIEIAVLYQYVNFMPGNPFNNFNSQ